MSGAWFLRDDDTLWLIPGDSAMGLRLPLDSIPWVSEKHYPWTRQQDPSQPNCLSCRRNFHITPANRKRPANDLSGAVEARQCLPVMAQANAPSNSVI